MCLWFEPWTAVSWAQTNPLSYGGHLDAVLCLIPLFCYYKNLLSWSGIEHLIN